MAEYYTLNRSELAQRLFNPTSGKNKFQPLDSELVTLDNGQIMLRDINSYIDRAIEQYPYLAQTLRENEPVSPYTPSYGDITKQNIGLKEAVLPMIQNTAGSNAANSAAWGGLAEGMFSWMGGTDWSV